MNSFEVFKWLDLNIMCFLEWLWWNLIMMSNLITVQKQFPETINFKWYKIISSMSLPSLKRHLTMEKKNIKYTGKHIIFFWGGGVCFHHCLEWSPYYPFTPTPFQKKRGEKKN